MKSYDEKMKWFNEARFGMFVHWGLYSILGRGEWVMYQERIPKEEYAKLADEFNPSRFDAEEWVSLAEKAGMKYMVLTTRHHDGFCLFDSKVSNFTSVKTRAKRDFVAEYVKACRKRGMRIGFYYSLLDWRFPGYFDREKYPESFNNMVEQAHGQVRELMTNYGKIDYLFYDGEWIPMVEHNRTLIEQGESLYIADLWRSRELNAMVRELQPEIIINNRSGLLEDVDTPEQHIIPSKEGRCWETCMTIGDSYGWGYIKHNPNLKSTTQLIQHLVTVASGGGNYLLNVGPKPDGTYQEEFIQRLTEIGEWMEVNGEAIYGSQRFPEGFGTSIIGTVTAKDNMVYFHIFRWPGEEAVMVGVKNKILSATILETKEKVRVRQNGSGRVFIGGLPQVPPNKHDTVIALELDGRPEAFSYERIPL
ncbi:MAG TPA: alpha-L-fucosidase [Candidatus Omnitrophica bacterium]|nr:alpha-L-fucosidase [Candidatus Omnitrophota bacterium]